MVQKVPYPEFAQRLELACDNNPDVPPLNHGRLKWFQDELHKRGVNYQQETVRK